MPKEKKLRRHRQLAKSPQQEAQVVDADIQTYSTGRYGIVDLYYRHIWINHWNEAVVHEVHKAFWSKATTAVFDLAWFDNYTDQTVDSTVSLNWKIPTCQNLESLTLKLSLKNDVLFNTQTEYESKLLLNEPTQCNLTPACQHELQNQMLLLISVIEYTFLWQPEHRTTQRELLLLDIRNIFLTEIDTAIICEKLYELATARISAPDDAPARILKLLGKLYA
jgi:hypothetical protein